MFAQKIETEDAINQEQIERCPCLEGTAYSAEVKNLLSLSSATKTGSYWQMHKVMAVFQLCFHFRKMEEQLPDDPAGKFSQILESTSHYLRSAEQSRPPFDFPAYTHDSAESLEAVTADHYGNLFSAFDESRYYEEPVQLLEQRLSRNGFDLSWLKEKSALDAGCGNGRYTHALLKLGAKQVTGIDMSEINIGDAKKRRDQRGITGLHYDRGSVLDMPYEDASFDFVFSNGVLHHSTDLDKGIGELLRVMKQSARGFLMLINAPGGIKWDMIEICRELLRDVPHRLAHNIFALLNIPANLRFLYLDHILVPINLRLTQEEIAEILQRHGAVNIRRFERDADVDEFEKFADYEGKEVMWGSGIHRFIFEKGA